MLVLHATWGLDHRLHVWAEDAAAFEGRERGRARRGARSRGAAAVMPHPWAASPEAIARALGDRTGGDPGAVGRSRSGSMSLWLPGTRSEPRPSPRIGSPPEAAPKADLAASFEAWSVATLAFEPGAACRLLLAGADRQDGGGGVNGGEASLTHLTATILLALELVARGRFLPGLAPVPGAAYAAHWLPVPGSADAERLRTLARAMPPACRAEAVAPFERRGRAAADVLAQILTDVVDAVARGGAGRLQVPGYGPAKGRTAASRAARTGGGAPLATMLTELTAAVPVAIPNTADVRGVASAVAAWRRRAWTVDPGFRTCFRVVPPEDAEQEASADGDGGTAAAPMGAAPAPAAGSASVPATPPGKPAKSPPKSPPKSAVDASLPWALEVLLQASDDPSLLVPAADVWTAGRRLAAFGRRLDDPQERLLADLGRATRLHPPLDPLLHQAQPARLALDVADAYAFLRDGAPVLAEAGFGIQLPSWWQAGRPRVSARLRASTRQSGATSAAQPLLGLNAIVDYRWELAIGDATVSAAEMRELARLKVPLVRVRGQWVELRPEDVAAAVRLVEHAPRRRTRGGEQDVPDGTLTVGDVVRIGLGLEASGLDLPVSGVTADGWLGALLAASGPEWQPAATGTPDGFEGTLRAYQERGLAWLAFLGGLGLGACLADDMGLGKTAQVLALLVAERNRAVADAAGVARPVGEPVGGPVGEPFGGPVGEPFGGPTLVVCPMSVVENWRREAERFAPDLTVHVHHGADRLGGGDLAAAAAGHDLVITTYGLVARDIEALVAIGWGRLVLDEAQNIKNSGSRQAQAVRRIAAPRRIALTGTPVENRLAELWSIMEVLNPGLLGSAGAFHQRFAVPIERYGDSGAASRLRKATAPFILRRLKSDRTIIADLPDKLEMTVFCTLTREQATLYQAVVDEMLERIRSTEGIERRGLVLATMLRLKQVCNHPAQMLADGSALAGRSGKLARIEEILEEVLAEGDRAILFTQFAAFGTLLRTHLRDRFGQEVLYLHGGTRKPERDAMVTRFQAPDGPSLMILSLKAGGTGLNLTAASQVIHVDRWWNPAVEDQATDRAYRIGQRRNVQVRKLVCAGTLEDRIATMLESKRALADSVIGTGETWLSELSNDELRDLVTLSSDAVAEG